MVKVVFTKTQMDAIKLTGEHILIKGVPGSGKTLVLLSKLQNILKEDPNASILFITYNKTLKKYIEDSLKQANPDLDLTKINLDVSTYHGWAKRILESISEYKIPIKKNEFQEFFQTLDGAHRFYQDEKYESFIDEEIIWIKEKGISNFLEYKEIRRTGRGTALQVADREEVFVIFEKWNEYLRQSQRCMWQDYAIRIDNNMDKILREYPYDYVLIDEAQDLSQMQLITLRKLPHKGLVVAADLGQKIYKTDFTWISVGIKVQGGRTKALEHAFRSTSEIMALANSLLKHDSTLNGEDIEQNFDTHKSGLMPVVCSAQDYKFEMDLVVKLIKEIQHEAKKEKFEPTIGVLLFDNASCDTWNNSFNKYKGIKSELIRDEKGSALTPGVKILTMHSAKGLEFDYVIITKLSSKFPTLFSKLEDDKQSELDMKRRLLYVSMTRAKENVYLTYKGEPSRYIDELDSSLYLKE